MDGIAPLETFWGSLAGLFRAGNTFFPGGVWGRIWLPRSKPDKDWTNDNANHASASFWFRGFRLANELSPLKLACFSGFGIQSRFLLFHRSNEAESVTNIVTQLFFLLFFFLCLMRSRGNPDFTV